MPVLEFTDTVKGKSLVVVDLRTPIEAAIKKHQINGHEERLKNLIEGKLAQSLLAEDRLSREILRAVLTNLGWVNFSGKDRLRLAHHVSHIPQDAIEYSVFRLAREACVLDFVPPRKGEATKYALESEIYLADLAMGVFYDRGSFCDGQHRMEINRPLREAWIKALEPFEGEKPFYPLCPF